MERNWNLSLKKVMLCSVAALLAAANTYAFPQGPTNSKRNNDSCPAEEKPGPFAFNYAKDLGIDCPSDFYAFGEFLYFQSQEDGLDYAMVNMSVANQTGGAFPLVDGTIQGFSTGSHDWNFNPGFRIGFGAYMGYDAWNIDLRWMYMRIKDDVSISVQNTGVLLATWIPASQAVSANNRNASQRWRGSHNVIDVALAKPFHPSRYFIFNPFFGFRASMLDQYVTARYSGTYQSADGVKMQATNKSWGVGLRGGAAAEYLLGAGWNLFASLGGSMLYGNFDISQQLPLGTVSYDTEQDFYGNQPNMDLTFGLAWGYKFNNNKTRVGLSVAYEFQQWWKQNRLIRFLGDGAGASPAPSSASVISYMPMNGDLSYNGFAFKMQFDF